MKEGGGDAGQRGVQGKEAREEGGRRVGNISAQSFALFGGIPYLAGS